MSSRAVRQRLAIAVVLFSLFSSSSRPLGLPSSFLVGWLQVSRRPQRLVYWASGSAYDAS